MNSIFRKLKIIPRYLFILFYTTNLALPAYSMSSLKTLDTHSSCGKISISNLQAYCDNPKIFGIESEINIGSYQNLYAKIDELINWIKNYNYSGDDFCFYHILEVTKKYISKIKPNDKNPILEELGIYEHQDRKGRISFNDFKLCLVIVLNKLC